MIDAGNEIPFYSRRRKFGGCLIYGRKRCRSLLRLYAASSAGIRLLAIALIFLLFTTFFIYSILHYEDGSHKIGRTERSAFSINGHLIRIFQFDNADQCKCGQTSNLEREKRVFQSVRQEHIKLIERLNSVNENLRSILKEISVKENELKELELRIEELHLVQREIKERRNVEVKLPNAPLLFPIGDDSTVPTGAKSVFRRLDDAIDYRRCSISSTFHFYLYDLSDHASTAAQGFHNVLKSNIFLTDNVKLACIFVAVFDESPANFVELKYWNNYGRNHLLLILNSTLKPINAETFQAAMVVSSDFAERGFRPDMDIAANLVLPGYSIMEYQHLPQLLPYARENLLSFLSGPDGLTSEELLNLRALQLNKSGDRALIITNCSTSSGNLRMGLCFDERRRIALLRRSFYSLIFADSASFQRRFYEALMAGSVPVVISTDDTQSPLPFQKWIDWRLAAFRIPPARFPELHFVLRSISVADLLELRRKGRFFLENYLMNTRVLSNAILSSLRHRLQMFTRQAFGVSDGTSVMREPKFSSAFVSPTRPPYDDEYLGPAEAPFPSSAFAHNYTSLGMYSYDTWNRFPHHIDGTPEFLELDHALPSEAEFDTEANIGMRPIQPGSGSEFSMALGGNRPREQFTILMVSYNRDSVLNASLERLYKLPYLNRVIVLWNNVNRTNNLTWPRLHVPVIFVNATRNSLNNRFLPLSEIETEAVLSMDDDIDLKQHEIVFAFRTWREQRNRLVGFPARHHARYGDSMFYNSNHTCQLSVILTGAAFIHKSYFHAYTHLMPAIIRRKVDEWMNCEDLAMNFLVAHLTRQPPIKTTSKWTLRCPTCPETLSDDVSHFNERHNCIRFFTQVYGYNPLLFSQFRADSVLFKTRVPAQHQKCFRYV